MEQQSTVVVERLKKVFTSLKNFVAGCSSAEDVIQVQLERLDQGGAAASPTVFNRFEILCISLANHSMTRHFANSNSIEDVLRVEIVLRLLISTIFLTRSNPADSFVGLVHLEKLEKLIQDQDHFNEEIAGYGYEGITLTSVGGLQIAAIELMGSGKLALEKVKTIEPLLVNEIARDVFFSHYSKLSSCFERMENSEGSIPWFEAALSVATFGLNYLAPISNVESATYGSVRKQHRRLAKDIHRKLSRMYLKIGKCEEAAKHRVRMVLCTCGFTCVCGGREVGNHYYTDIRADVDREFRNQNPQNLVLPTSMGIDPSTLINFLKECLFQISKYPDVDLSEFRAETLELKGSNEVARGDFEDCILSLEEVNKIYEEKALLKTSNPFVARVQLTLVLAYARNNDYWAASRLLRNFQPIMDKYHKEDPLWHVWEFTKAFTHLSVGDLKSTDKAMDIDIPKELNRDDPTWTVVKQMEETVALHGEGSQQQSDTEILETCDLEESKSLKEDEVPGLHPQRSRGIALNLAKIRIKRASVLARDKENNASLERALNDLQQQVVFLRREAGEEVLLASALFYQAAAVYNLLQLKFKSHDRGSNKVSQLSPTDAGAICCLYLDYTKLIDEAIQVVEQKDCNRELLAQYKFCKALCLQSFDPSTLEAKYRDAILISAELQLQLKDMETAWVGTLDLQMRHMFIFMQLLLGANRIPIKPLLWAERGRERFFSYLIRQQGNIDCSDVTLDRADKLAGFDPLQLGRPQFSHVKHATLDRKDKRAEGDRLQLRKPHLSLATWHLHGCCKCRNPKKISGSDELWFDRDDELAEKHLFQTVVECGRGALILEYTCDQFMCPRLIICVVFIDSGNQHVVECNYESSLQEVLGLLKRTKKSIKDKNDEEAREDLSRLHSLLIKPVQKYVNCCQRLILSVHRELVSVPFAALYNKQSNKFLVEEKVISIIPSIRVLHHCFSRQHEFERNMQKGLLHHPFVAGNPEPMGWKQKPLPGAAEEAKFVAQVFGKEVKPCIGPSMNKKVVKDGLSSASMVLLASHAVKTEYFPHGALILQHQQKSTSQRNESPSTSLDGNLSTSSKNNAPEWGNSAITADELASLPAGIRAGLVVLSACGTGDGEITSEGSLGLGRSLLQGGASAAILSLWNVDDSNNKVLIAGVFEKLVKEGKDAAEALQLTMLEMLDDGVNGGRKYAIRDWASMFVLGSPSFKYPSLNFSFSNLSLSK